MPKDAAEPAIVHLTAPLVRLFPGAEAKISLSTDTVDRLIDELDRRWPGMRDRLVDSRPAIRRHINVFVDGERATLKTAIPSGAEIYILTAMSGG